jgi:ketosteroid isomerase-like protein
MEMSRTETGSGLVLGGGVAQPAKLSTAASHANPDNRRRMGFFVVILAASLSDSGGLRMTPIRSIAFAALLACLSVLSTQAGRPVAQSDPVTARCEVWDSELAFAKSIATHDAAAFAALVHPQAAFGVSRKPTLGREAIVREWQGLIDGSALKLEWYPDVVTLGGDGRIAYSSGPALYQDPHTGAYRHGRFGSVWQRDEDGTWRVVFDDGLKPEPASDAQVQAFRAGQGAGCRAM